MDGDSIACSRGCRSTKRSREGLRHHQSDCAGLNVIEGRRIDRPYTAQQDTTSISDVVDKYAGVPGAISQAAAQIELRIGGEVGSLMRGIKARSKAALAVSDITDG